MRRDSRDLWEPNELGFQMNANFRCTFKSKQQFKIFSQCVGVLQHSNILWASHHHHSQSWQTIHLFDFHSNPSISFRSAKSSFFFHLGQFSCFFIFAFFFASRDSMENDLICITLLITSTDKSKDSFLPFNFYLLFSSFFFD